MTKDINKFVFNNAITRFFVSVLLSSLLWFLTVLSNKYSTVEIYKVRYVNLPEGKILVNKLPQSLSVEISAAGFRLFLLNLRDEKDTLLIDLDKRIRVGQSNDYILQINNQVKQISDQLGEEYVVQKILPEVITIQLDKKASKLFDLKLNLETHFKKQYEHNGSVSLLPTKLLVQGPQAMLDRMKQPYFQTEKLVLRNLDKTTQSFVNLQIDDDYNALEFSTKRVLVNVPVERYTETSIELPVVPMNVPSNVEMKLFPEHLTLKFWVGLSHYNKIDPTQFKLAAEYTDVTEPNQTKVKVKMLIVPPFILYPNLPTSKVEFIIRKR